jgi:predicted N-acetyltransferase YhbS
MKKGLEEMSGTPPLSEVSRGRRAGRRETNKAGQTLAIVPARPGDYASTQQFLTSVFRGPSPAEFRASAEDPAHEPGDRLLLKRGHDVLGHALVTHRSIRFGRSVVSAAGLQRLATNPELRGQGFGVLLLRRAERHMIDEGHALGLLATTRPEFFARFGWTACGRRNQYSANVCKILSVLAAKGLHPKIRKPLDIRPLRRMEVSNVAKIYRVNVSDRHGPLERSEAYWQWLVNRGAYDEFLVAIDRRSAHRSPDRDAVIVGYAVLRGDRIVELFTLPDHNKAGIQLLSRACGEAIERGIDTLRVELAPRHRLIRVLRAAGAVPPSRRRCDDVLMAKVLSPERMLRWLGSEFVNQATTAGLPLPLDFGLAVESQKYQVSIDSPTSGNGHASRTVDVATGSMGRSYLRIEPARLTELLLGQVDWKSPGNIELSTKLAEQAAAVLFPRRTLWRPPFDDLPAKGR